MGEAAPRFPSFEDLYDAIAGLREGLTGEILEPGLIRVMPRPGHAHRHAAKQLLEALRPKDEDVRGRGWWIESEAEVRIGDRLVVPDLLGFRVERFASRPTENPLRVVPDWACEILSPSNASDDRRLKLPIYAEAGVAHVWLVDPDVRTVEVYVPEAGRPLRAAQASGVDVARLPPFDDVALDVSHLWTET